MDSSVTICTLFLSSSRPSSAIRARIAGTSSQIRFTNRPGRAGSGVRMHTTPDALATSTAATRSYTTS